MTDFFDPEPVVLAHRGDSARFPENTMAAFESAVNMGVHVIETDVHLSSDGEVVIWHDETLERMSGDSRKINEMEWEEIREINAGYAFTPDRGRTYPYRNSPVRPVLLEELLIRFPDMRFNVDLKDRNPRLAERHASILQELNCIARVVTASFHKSTLDYFRSILPQAPTSCTSAEVVKLILLYRSGLLTLPLKLKKRVLQVPEYSGRLRILTPGFVKYLHRKGLKVQVWTVNEEREMARFLDMGVDGIFTDRPALLLDCLKKRQKL